MTARFAELHPRVLGALCDAVAIAIRNLAGVRLAGKSRMATFETWAVAAEPVFGCEPGSFLAAYRANRAGTHDVILESSPVAVAILDLLAKQGGSWQGTPTELYADLHTMLDDAGKHVFPRTPKALSDAVKRLAPNLRAKGIEASQPPRADRRMWTIRRVYSGSTKGGNSASVATAATVNAGSWLQNAIPAPTQERHFTDAPTHLPTHADARGHEADARLNSATAPKPAPRLAIVAADATDARFPPLVAPVQVAAPPDEDMEDITA